MNLTASRRGNFTSSKISALMSSGKAKDSLGKPALTYIEEKNMERRLGRSLNADVSSRPTSWGNLVELQAFNLLGLEYKICSTETIKHQTIDFWSGSPDCEKFDEGKTVVDIKCPFTLKSFCSLIKTTGEGIEAFKDEYPDYFYQLVSNAVLTGSKYAELIVYMPYKEELDAIRELASNWDGNQNKIAWVGFAEDNDLPFLIEGNYYKNLNVFRFEVTEADKQALTDRVIECGKLLDKVEQPVQKYNPTEEQIFSAQEKIKMMKQLNERLKIVSI